MGSEIKKMSFEEAIHELEDIVKRLEDGKGNLDEAIDMYERGIGLKQHCEKRLKEAQMRIEKIMLAEDGTQTTEAYQGA